MAVLEKLRNQYEKKSQIFLRNIPTHVKDQFKGYCARRGTNMTEEIVKYMRDCVASESKPIHIKRNK